MMTDDSNPLNTARLTDRLPRRPYGPDGVELSIIGFGGLVVKDYPHDRAARVVAEAVEMGVNYFDVAPTYGNAEEILGPALQPWREKAFLACKTTQRRRGPAEEEFRQSLKNLRTDRFELYQLHSLTDVAEDVDVAFASGGVMEMVAEAKAAGAIRHVGFSAHTEEAALDRYPFDSVLFPLNFACWHGGGFGPRVVERARQSGATLLALKAMAREPWGESPDPAEKHRFANTWYRPITDPAEACRAVRFTLSLPIAAMVPPASEELWRLAVECGLRYRPLSEEQARAVKDWALQFQPVFPLRH